MTPRISRAQLAKNGSKGFTQSVKEVFQGNHFYRSDTGKCARCRRYRPEVHWNAENMPEADCCDRCTNFTALQMEALSE